MEVLIEYHVVFWCKCSPRSPTRKKIFFRTLYCFMFDKLHSYLKNQFSLDTRALALMRICLGFILLADWFIRLSDLTAHYTNEGVLPTSVVYSNHWREGYFSFFLWSDALWWQYLLFSIAILFSFFFLVGYFTRFSTLVIWLLILSVHVRNPFIIQGGDEVLRIGFFWFLFLPLANHYSVDSFYLNKNSETKVFSAASVGFMLLIFAVYFFSALLKTSAEWRSDGTALYYALSLDQMAYSFGKWLLNYPSLLKVISIGVFYLEVIAPLLFFIPFNNKVFRSIGIILLILLHIGISVTLFVGLFFLIGISTLIGLLPSELIEWKMKRVPSVVKNTPIFNYMKLVVPTFVSLRNFGTKFLMRCSNFYTQTLLTFFLTFIICICFVWNLGNVRGTNIGVSEPFHRMIYALGMHQDWGMFAPSVLKDDGWFVLDAHTGKGEQIDIYKEGKKTNFEKPESVLKYIKNDRWRKFEENYIMDQYFYIRPFYCDYLLKTWNNTHSEKIDSLSVIYVKERTLPDYQKIIPTKEILCNCKIK